MRGKATTTCPTNCPGGITPAYAGKRPCPDRGRPAGWDHPRVCGEKAKTCARCRVPPGSPPRMRGKVTGFLALFRLNGITPAYAGKSPSPVISNPERGDHPRVCGEKPMNVFSSFAITGSPPRMRGKGGIDFDRDMMLRITPAYAGKRKWNYHTTNKHGDHPRVCGEK